MTERKGAGGGGQDADEPHLQLGNLTPQVVAVAGGSAQLILGMHPGGPVCLAPRLRWETGGPPVSDAATYDRRPPLVAAGPMAPISFHKARANA